METKVCNKCGCERSLEDYYHYKNKKGKTIYKSYCIPCSKLKAKKWAKDNPERALQNVKSYQKRNPDKISKGHYYMDNQAGVYMVKNVITNECYIGASTNPRARVSHHFTASELPKPNELKLSIEKYSKKAFVWGILEYCDKEVLFEKETEYIKKYKPEWNTNKVK